MTATELLKPFDKLNFSQMAREDMEHLVPNLSPGCLASLKQCLESLNNMKARILTDMPRDRVNFSWEGFGMYGGLICKGDTYDLHS